MGLLRFIKNRGAGTFGRISLLLTGAALAAGCPQQTATTKAPAGSISGVVSSSASSSSSATSANSSSVTAIQIITKADSSGSFDSAIVPVSGGVSLAASRLYDLSGALIPSGSIPSWFVEARLFLTSTRTSAGAPTNTTSNTPCAYFDSYSDNNPDSSGYYTIDGYNVTQTGILADIDQCAGTAAAELNQLGFYVRVDRRFMSSNDKLQVIVKAKALEEPNTAPTSSSCVVGGIFNASNCSNQVYTLTRRTSPGAPAKPFINLFPSAKAWDLLAEDVLIPLSDDTNISTISIDRVKGGAVFYGITIIKMQ
ncbi:MAG TPA: hypothetical protein PLH57_00270 [Oligoflexia bacterium]|mgnify:CR=1 FL=1|nr:hypothetical protein [Oligoflexia bacterium]